jgi:hypothetical protein
MYVGKAQLSPYAEIRRLIVLEAEEMLNANRNRVTSQGNM